MATTVGTGSYVQAQGGTLSRVDRPDVPTLEIPSEPLIVGRAPQCGLSIDESTVTWMHAKLEATERMGIRIRDLNSRNGTFVQGVRVIEGYLPATPVRVAFGDALFQFTPGGFVQLDVSTADAFGPLKGDAPAMRRLFATLRNIATTDRTVASNRDVLITGPTGTGKELIARAIHDAGPRAKKPFIVIDCASLPAALAESVLFGHERGAFTGATSKQLSPFIEAEGGTVFLDEIGELPLDLQTKLLRVLQERKVKAVGSNTYRDINVRIIAATLLDLARAINTREFRADLFFRLDKLAVEVPPLTERREDIPTLLQHFASEAGVPDLVDRIPHESMGKLMTYHWPGNVRELENLVVKATAFLEPGPIRIEKYITSKFLNVPSVAEPSFAEAIDCDNPNDSEDEALRRFWTRMHKQYDGNITKIAFFSQKGRAAVRRALLKYGLIRSDRSDD